MVCIKSVRIRFKPSIPRLLSFLHIFLMLKAMAKKAKSIVTCLSQSGENVDMPIVLHLSEDGFGLNAPPSSLPDTFPASAPFPCLSLVFVQLVLTSMMRLVLCPIQIQRCLSRVTGAIEKATHNVGCTFFRHTLTILYNAIGGRSALRTPTPRSK